MLSLIPPVKAGAGILRVALLNYSAGTSVAYKIVLVWTFLAGVGGFARGRRPAGERVDGCGGGMAFAGSGVDI
jgi:hypothetical protein